MLTLEKFKHFPDGMIMASGITTDNPEGVNMTNSGNELRWIAKKGDGDDWAIYIHWSHHTLDYIKTSGDKVNDKRNIVKLVPCSDEVMKRYRH